MNLQTAVVIVSVSPKSALAKYLYLSSATVRILCWEAIYLRISRPD